MKQQACRHLSLLGDILGAGMTAEHLKQSSRYALNLIQRKLSAVKAGLYHQPCLHSPQDLQIVDLVCRYEEEGSDSDPKAAWRRQQEGPFITDLNVVCTHINVKQ